MRTESLGKLKEEQLKVGPKGAQHRGRCKSSSESNKTNFHEMGSGFAGEFHLRYDSCSFGKFVVQNSTVKGHGAHGDGVEGREKWRSRTGLDFLTELTEF